MIVLISFVICFSLFSSVDDTLIDGFGSESQQVGTFGEPSDDWVNDNFNDLVDDLEGTGMDLVGDISPSPVSSPGNFIEEDFDDENIEAPTSSPIDGNSLTFDSDLLDGVVEEYNEEISNNSYDVEAYDSSLIEPLAHYDVYYGSIPSTYVEYMRGYLPKLKPKEHYVGARVGQYDYIFAFGEDLSFDGVFDGRATVIKWNTYNSGTFSFVIDDNFYLDPHSYLVYSDLSVVYPSLASSGDFTLRQVLYLLVIGALVVTMIHMYQVRKIRRSGS